MPDPVRWGPDNPHPLSCVDTEWKRMTAHSDSQSWSHVTDVIFFYSKSDKICWNPLYTAHNERYLQSKYTGVDPDGRRYRLDNFTSPNPRPHMTYKHEGHKAPGRQPDSWACRPHRRRGTVWNTNNTKALKHAEHGGHEGPGRQPDSWACRQRRRRGTVWNTNNTKALKHAEHEGHEGPGRQPDPWACRPHRRRGTT